MGKFIYLIVRHDFNEMENRNPYEITNIGYIEDELDADKWIESHNDKELGKSWGKVIYPYYTKEKIEKINI